MTLRELLKKADELELIARELRAMAYIEQKPVPKESAEPPREGGKPGDRKTKVEPDHG